MGGRKVTILFDEDDFLQLEERAKKSGIGRASTLIRHLAVHTLREECTETESKKTISVTVTNYDELAGYVAEKKLGSVAIFATMAMEQQMQRVPLTAAQKARVEKSIG